MNRDEFLRRLKALLSDMGREELEQVEEYYEELLYDGLEQGYTEEEILKGFGSPEEAARKMREEYGGLIVYEAKSQEEGYEASDMVHTVKVEAANVRIRVRTVEDGPIRVLFKPREGCDQVSFKEENGIFSFQHKMKGFLHLNWLNLFIDFSVIILEIPKSFAGSLQLKTSNAAIAVSNLSQLGKGEFVSSNGKIRAENIRAGALKLQTQNGTVVGRNLISDDITMQTCNGSIMGSVIGNANDYTIESRTVNGSNNLAQCAAVQGRLKHLKAWTTNGRIQVEFIG